MPTPVPTVPPRRAWRQLRRSTKITLVALLILLAGGGLEVVSRAYWRFAKGVPFFRTDRIWHNFFPEWEESGLNRVAPHHGDGSFDVLFLGASALTDAFGRVGPELTTALERKLARTVRVVNLAVLGRTTRDSMIKYERLGDKRFDLVLIYHGINDSFLNNIPPGAFKADYTHAARFEQLRLFEQHREVGLLAFPFTLRYAKSRVLEQTRLGQYAKRKYFPYGADIRTPAPFRANVEQILNRAAERGDRVVLMTYAYYLPANYSEEAFQAQALDYGTHSSPISLWGEAANVTNAIDRHNEVIRALAAGHPEALFVDQRALMPVGKEYFNDCCHLTGPGSKRFVEHIMARLGVDRLSRR